MNVGSRETRSVGRSGPWYTYLQRAPELPLAMRSTTAARSGDVATRRTHFPLLSFGLAIALLASWLFFGAVLLNFPAAQHNACGSVWNSSSPAADGEDSSRIARTPLRARRRLAQSKPSEATEGPLRAAARLVETTRAAERNATLAREVAEKELERLISLRLLVPRT